MAEKNWHWQYMMIWANTESEWLIQFVVMKNQVCENDKPRQLNTCMVQISALSQCKRRKSKLVMFYHLYWLLQKTTQITPGWIMDILWEEKMLVPRVQSSSKKWIYRAPRHVRVWRVCETDKTRQMLIGREVRRKSVLNKSGGKRG